MAVPAVITDLLVAVADNVPKGSDSVTTSTGPDEFFRAHAAIVRRLHAKGADVASAATVDLGAINDGSYVKITGTTTITSFGTIAAGVERTLLFADALTLTHDAAKIILPGAANIVTVAEDVAVFVSEGAGLWRCKSYQRNAVAEGSFRAYQDTAQAIAATTFTKVLFQVENYDTGGNFASSTFTAPAAGVYMFACAISSTWADGGRAFAMFYVNGARHTRFFDFSSGSADNGSATGSALIKLAAADTVEVYAYYLVAGDTIIGSEVTHFSGIRIG